MAYSFEADSIKGEPDKDIYVLLSIKDDTDPKKHLMHNYSKGYFMVTASEGNVFVQDEDRMEFTVS